MDWSPTEEKDIRLGEQSRRGKQRQDDDGSWLRPQRFFAPEKPTGLEHLFERTKLVDDDAMPVDEPPSSPSRFGQHWKVATIVSVVVVSLPMFFLTLYRKSLGGPKFVLEEL